MLLLVGPALGQDLAAAAVPEIVEFGDGSRLRGVVVEEDSGVIVFDADTFGRITFPADAVARRLDADAPLGPPAPTPATPSPSTPAASPTPPGLFGTTLLEEFDKSVGFGISGREADTSVVSLNASATANFDGPDRRWRFNSGYFYTRTDGVRSQDQGLANLRRDFLLPARPPFVFIEGRAQYDAFQAWRVRTGGFVGVGYALSSTDNAADGWLTIDDDRLTLLARVGVGGSYEFGSVNEFQPEALLAVEAAYQLFDSTRIAAVSTLFPDLDDPGEYRNTTELTADVTLDRARGLTVSAGALNEYLSTTPGDQPQNTLTYFARLVLSF